MRNVNRCKENIHAEFANYSPPSRNPNEQAVYLNNFLIKILNKYFPIKTKSISPKRIKAPWITTKIIKCIQKKHRWFRLMRSGRITNISYKQYAAELRKLLRMAEEKYYQRKLLSLNNDMKRSWKILNKLLGRNQMSPSNSFLINNQNISDPKNISEAFSKYFVEHPKNIHDSIPPSTVDFSGLIPRNNNTANFPLCTENEVYLLLCKMKKEGSFEDIPRKFLRLCIDYIINPLTSLINVCISEGVFPDILKEAKITPIFKKGDRKFIHNYRPISVLKNISKIFESVMYSRLEHFFTEQNLLSEKQFGFRKNKSTEMAVLDLIYKLLPAIENKKFAVCVFLDYSACFDTISRDILIKKLETYGITGTELALFKSYFANRRQYVFQNGAESSKCNQNIGVVQGSRLGPLLYDIYSNDFNNLCSNDENILYADDTCLVYNGDNLENLIRHVNNRLAVINDWCNVNKLFLNRKKSEYMIVTNKVINFTPELFIANDKLTRVETFKYLGVHIDSSLKFHSQLNAIKSKISQVCGASYRLSKYIDKASARKLYFSCFYSIVQYCICIYGGVLLCTQRCTRLLRLQDKTMKNLFSASFPTSQNLHKDTGILKLPDIYRLRVAVYMYRCTKLNECPTIRNNLTIEYPSHSYETRSAHNLVLPFPRVETIRMNFKYQFVDIWNSVPAYLKELSSVRAFKKSLIKYFIERY